METGFNGLIPTIMGSKTKNEYKPEYFSIKDLDNLFKNQSSPPREYSMPMGGYAMAVLNDDKTQIEFYERRGSVDKITKFKGLIKQWGNSKARVIASLDKVSKGFQHRGNLWTLYSYGEWKYKDIYDGELDTIMLMIKLNEDKFNIELYADDADGYSGYKYKKILSQNISFNSILNQIKYFTKKLENGSL